MDAFELLGVLWPGAVTSILLVRACRALWLHPALGAALTLMAMRHY